jgi:adenylate kinase
LDGAIRSLDQAKVFQEYFTANKLIKEIRVVYISLPDEESYNGLTKRRVCLSCRANIPYLPSTKDLKSCPHCKGELIRRQDDTEEVIKERIKNQGAIALGPIVEYYKDLGVLKEVVGNCSIEEVEKSVFEAIN